MKTLWIQLLSLVAASAFGSTTNGLIAFFRLAEDGRDSSGESPPMSLTNAPFVHGRLYLNGYYEYGGTPNGYRSTAAVPRLNYESVSFALDFYPLPPGRRTGPNRFERFLDSVTRGRYEQWFGHYPRDDSNIFTAGTSYRWLGFRLETNLLQLALNNLEFLHTFDGAKVRPGRWHNLICSLDLPRRQVLTMLDGQKLETITLPQDFKLAVIGSDADASDREITFVDYANGSVFYGFAANLKVFDHSLIEPELPALYLATAAERPQLNPMDLPVVVLLFLGIAGALVAVLVRRRRLHCGARNQPSAIGKPQ